MHFWIDKRSQGCGFNGRYRIPPSISGYGRNQRNLSSGFYSEPMVTPVRRFQSIESVANNGLRYGRTSHHSRSHSGYSPTTVHYNASNSIIIPPLERPPEMLRISGTTRSVGADRKLRCIGQVLVAAVLVIIFFMCSFYVYKGVGVPFPTHNLFVWLVLIVTVVMIIVVLYMTIAQIMIHKTPAMPMVVRETPTVVIEQHSESEEMATHQSVSPVLQNPEEVPPPPYHIAVHLAPQNNSESAPIIRDSPPPSYEKAVT